MKIFSFIDGIGICFDFTFSSIVKIVKWEFGIKEWMEGKERKAIEESFLLSMWNWISSCNIIICFINTYISDGISSVCQHPSNFRISENMLNVISKCSIVSRPCIDQGGRWRVFLGALTHGLPATANLHNALTCSGKAYSIPTRGPIRMFSGLGPSRISNPPENEGKETVTVTAAVARCDGSFDFLNMKHHELGWCLWLRLTWSKKGMVGPVCWDP